MDRRSFLRAGAVVGCSVGLGGCVGGAGGGVDYDYDVGMTTRRFEPTRIEVAPGETVVWRNTSSHAHTVTAYGERLPPDGEFWSTGEFDSQSAAESAWRSGSGGALYQGDVFEREFTVPGEHHYFCIPHEASGMSGVVVVTDEGATTGTEP